jgi:hypothetical protein
MSVAAPEAPPADGTRAGRAPRVAAWVAIGVGLVLAGLLGAVLFGAQPWAKKAPLDAESAAPTGARALVQILEQHGVQVEVVRDRQSALDALRRTPSTLAVPDSPYLSDAALRELVDTAADAVVIQPRARSLRLLFEGSTPAGFASAALPPACDLATARRAGTISAAALAKPGADVAACYPGDGGAALLQVTRASGPLSALDGGSLLSNEHLAENGNAALGIGLLGTRTTLVWYTPSIADSDLSAAPTLGSLTPEWVSPVIVLLLAAGVAAGVWRGRRFGPLVAENLPVTVRVGETAEGRARLYSRAHDAAHALDQLRHGAVARIARLLGLAPAAAPHDVADAAAARLGADRAMVRAILVDSVPRSDRDLAQIAGDLHDLEAAVRAAVRPGGPR